jgi:uncharacterized protein with GYD domain
MAETYLLLVRADAAASLRLLTTGTRGAEGQQAAIADRGGKVLSQWALLGRYDLAVIAEFPDSTAAAAYCLSSNASGYAVELHVALAPDAVDKAASLVMPEEYVVLEVAAND